MKLICLVSVAATWWGLCGATILPYATPDRRGVEVADQLRRNYDDLKTDCGAVSRPSFLCSGAILRGTIYSDGYRSWDPSPQSKDQGATSFSFLRKDAKFNSLAYNLKNGYILYPEFLKPVSTMTKVSVLCAFPIDAGSHVRLSAGCGDFTTTPQVEDYCQNLGINTAEQWDAHYRSNGGSHALSCGFNVAANPQGRGAEAFMAMLRSMKYTENENFSNAGLSNNEIRIAAWPSALAEQLPIQAFFYLDGGVDSAKKDQRAFYADGGRFVPVIKLNLPSTPEQDATFTYSGADQASLGDVVCKRYIDSASWEKRFDPGLNSQAWTLSVIPTDCGRSIGPGQTEAFYSELSNDYGSSAEWKERDGGGMRRQLVCLISTVRTKDVWNFEPFRPDTTHEKAVAAGCNNT
ncbi:DUF2599 domain-containing protein [Pseudomonas sp. SWRI92]|uniref:DUF2599 domain-containing protein n=1 Tax=Pseudomonas sp. SWRI92 TaxID=2745499 RepID=UPI0016463C71|nr:DUF2599 domain-containing protein [Pseudomonas sp. SWRI92]MBC3376797.1 DUF2599 domain-containing protein [Pseudomonas sp. SWRI92]